MFVTKFLFKLYHQINRYLEMYTILYRLQNGILNQPEVIDS